MQHHLGAHLLWQDPYCGLWIFSTTRGCLYTTQLSTASLSHLSHPLSKSALLLGLSASLLSLSSVQVTPVDVGGKRKKIFSFWVISVEQFCLQDSNTEYSTVSSRRLRKKSNVNSHFFLNKQAYSFQIPSENHAGEVWYFIPLPEALKSLSVPCTSWVSRSKRISRTSKRLPIWYVCRADIKCTILLTMVQNPSN